MDDSHKPRPYYAHTPPKDDRTFTRFQTMQSHVDGVEQRAVRFAAPFGAQELARWAAWLHDVGKYSDKFQDYLIACNEAKKRKYSPPKPGSAEHKCAGTKLAHTLFLQSDKALANLLASCVYGHHGGLESASKPKNAYELAEEDADDPETLEKPIQSALKDWAPFTQPLPEPSIIPAWVGLPSVSKDKPLPIEMLTRFVFSCLVDADSLDTEQHFEERKAQLRKRTSLENNVNEWQKALRRKLVHLRASKTEHQTVLSLRLRRVRREVYKACVKVAQKTPRVFSLTVPTGGGKTFSALAFALAHAIAHRNSQIYKRTRIIYAAPYTSILDQTADNFRKVLGTGSVLEHHSAVDTRQDTKDASGNGIDAQSEESNEIRRRLAAENWEAPLVVTTTVQLLESLFASNTSRCRKLHNIAGSIVILDEVQTLPLPILTPLLSGLRALVEQFGVTLVLCTATQPAFGGDTPYLDEAEEGFKEIYPIIPEEKCAEHFAALTRVTYRVVEQKWSWDQVAEEMQREFPTPELGMKPRSCLAVLNTKKDALALLKVMPRDAKVVHLSTLMCGAHRREVLESVKDALIAERKHDGPPVFLVSTQVIEAGVDIDFPRVLRALGPLDRIIQSAGRCNREGLHRVEESEVVVFDPIDGGQPGEEYKTATAHAIAMMQSHGVEFDFNAPGIATEYFGKLYGSFGIKGLDKENVQHDRRTLDFPSVSKKMRLIKDDTVPVLVKYNDEAREVLKTIQARIDWKHRMTHGQVMTRELWRNIQPYTVAVYQTEIPRLRASTLLDALVPDELFLWTGTYDPVKGIGDAVGYEIGELIIGSDRTR